MPRAVSIEIKTTMGKRLQRLLDSKGTKQQTLASALCVEYATINRIANGVSAPSIDLLIAIADHFECSVDYLLGRTFEKKI